MKRIVFIISVFLSTLTLSAQDFVGVSWDMSTGLSDTYNYISRPSLRGFTFFDMRSFLRTDISVGGSFGLNTFHNSLTGSFTDESATITGKQLRYINSLPLMANFHYYIDEDREDITFYVGSGIGTYILEQRTDMGLYTSGSGFKWHFGFQPQLGMLIPVSDRYQFHLAFKYHHAFKRSDWDGVNYLALSLGIARW